MNFLRKHWPPIISMVFGITAAQVITRMGWGWKAFVIAIGGWAVITFAIKLWWISRQQSRRESPRVLPFPPGGRSSSVPQEAGPQASDAEDRS